MFYGRLFSLDPALKPLFKGPEVEEAWVAAYGVLAKTMKDAAAVTA